LSADMNAKQYRQPDRELIQGVVVHRLTVIPDERGRVTEIVRRDDPFFAGFGQVYLTTVFPGVVKAWHSHKRQTDCFTCVKGMVKVALYDDREGSPTKGKVNEFHIGEHNPCVIAIPPGVCHGWKCTSEHEAYVINVPSEPYNYVDPDEYRRDPHDSGIPYDWARQDG